MTYFHRTTASIALIIVANGFRNGRGTYLTQTEHEGVWISTEALGPNEGAHGDVVLTIEAPEQEIRRFEWIEEWKPYREFLVPADVLNALGKITHVAIEKDYTVEHLMAMAAERGLSVEIIE